MDEGRAIVDPLGCTHCCCRGDDCVRVAGVPDREAASDDAIPAGDRRAALLRLLCRMGSGRGVFRVDRHQVVLG